MSCLRRFRILFSNIGDAVGVSPGFCTPTPGSNLCPRHNDSWARTASYKRKCCISPVRYVQGWLLRKKWSCLDGNYSGEEVRPREQWRPVGKLKGPGNLGQTREAMRWMNKGEALLRGQSQRMCHLGWILEVTLRVCQLSREWGTKDLSLPSLGILVLVAWGGMGIFFFDGSNNNNSDFIIALYQPSS